MLFTPILHHVMIMANAYTNPFIHNMGLDEKILLTQLLDKTCRDIGNKTNVIEHLKYYNDAEFKNVLQNADSKISILSLNCQRVNANVDKVKLFLANVSMECPILVICVQQSSADEGLKMPQVLLLNYSLIFESRNVTTHIRLIMYILDDFANINFIL